MYTFECTLKHELRSSCSITHVAGTRARYSLYSAAMADSVHADARPTGVHDVGGLDDDAPLDLREKPLAFWERQVLSYALRRSCFTWRRAAACNTRWDLF